MTRWAVLTGEYPPQAGGVSDYTRQVAVGLAVAGDRVTVYAPPCSAPGGRADPGVRVVRLPDRFSRRGLAALAAALRADPPTRLLVQYVPHAFGPAGLNLQFAAWLATRGRRLAPVWVMFHEVRVAFGPRPRQAAVAAGTWAMARLVAGAAERRFVSIPAWQRRLHGPVDWLPIPSNIPDHADTAAVLVARDRFAPGGGPLVGHFGTYGGLVTPLLCPALGDLLRRVPAARAVLVGRGSCEFVAGFVERSPNLAGRVAGAGELAPGEVPAALKACDVLVQPFPDGVSSRRTTVMAGLSNGVPVATHLGHLSEPLWADTDALAVAPAADRLADAAAGVLALPPADRLALGRRGADLYDRRFALRHTLAALRGGS